jgi:hypothetical protein
VNRPKMLAELILDLCAVLHREGNVPVLLHAPSSGGRGAVSVRRVEAVEIRQGPVAMITDGAEL